MPLHTRTLWFLEIFRAVSWFPQTELTSVQAQMITGFYRGLRLNSQFPPRYLGLLQSSNTINKFYIIEVYEYQILHNIKH